jgi:MFS family permease
VSEQQVKVAGIKLPSFDRRVWILSAGLALNQFGMSIVMPFLSIYLYVYQGVSAGLVGFALFFATFLSALAQLVGGELCDRLGRRTVLISGLALLILSFILLGWAVSVKAPYIYYLAFLSLTRISTGLFKPIPNIMAADMVSEDRRIEAFSILRIAQNTGFAIGPIVGGLMALFSYSSMFYFTAVTSTIYLLLVIFFIGDTRTCKPSGKFSLSGMVTIFNDRPFIVFSILAFLVSAVYCQMYSPLSMYAKDYAGLSEPEVGLMFAINGLMVIFIQFAVTRMSEKYRLTSSMGFGVLLYAIGFIMVSFSSGFLMIAACMVVITMGELFFIPPSISLSTNMASIEKRGRYQGFFGLASNMGFAVGPLIGGLLLDYFRGNPGNTWLVIGAAGLACAAGFIYLRKLVSYENDRA